MKYLSILLASLVCLQAWGDGHENQNDAPEAMAMETAVCSMKDATNCSKSRLFFRSAIVTKRSKTERPLQRNVCNVS